MTGFGVLVSLACRLFLSWRQGQKKKKKKKNLPEVVLFIILALELANGSLGSGILPAGTAVGAMADEFCNFAAKLGNLCLRRQGREGFDGLGWLYILSLSICICIYTYAHVSLLPC